ncbi:fatty acid desaturase family protein [Actinomadura macrotermitis]|uniref:NADPH-dependent stearoyl-CoA 9-desaturase n=1 Tax=Actinomadura macrotermitis TaxID=2585200 RepID=A0A7K0BTB8_9ACTN|nr:acyl-CoA desaturase [Actinomadura macrotermitis]MQY04419.1 NADPH-dependent stearoyl-CoA 9-desaturase [Actinomadura macrotermitis]
MEARQLTQDEADELGRELDKIRAEVIGDRGTADARYIRRVIAAQRGLEVAGRALLFGASRRWAWWGGAVTLAVAKSLENMEIGHNVMHGQWDWMRDPKIHSTTWEWDNACPADQWKHAHNVLHHTYTNVLGKDRDIGYTILRVNPAQPWHPVYLAQPLYNVLFAALFEFGNAVYDIGDRVETGGDVRAGLAGIGRKFARQAVKDYVAFPLLAGRNARRVAAANFTAGVLRNIWVHTVIFCGHFPGDVQVFPEDVLEGETRGQWYLRQLLGSCDITGGPLLHLMTGNLSHQIEHHLFPDLPSNRYAEIAPRVQEICARYGLPYHADSLVRQVAGHWGRVLRLAFPGGR